MTCEKCFDEQAGGYRPPCDGIESVDECPYGEVPKLSDENKKFWWLFERIQPGLYDGFGGINYAAITEAFRIYGVPASQRPVVFERCLLAAAAIKEVKEQKETDGQAA